MAAPGATGKPLSGSCLVYISYLHNGAFNTQLLVTTDFTQGLNKLQVPWIWQQGQPWGTLGWQALQKASSAMLSVCVHLLGSKNLVGWF